MTTLKSSEVFYLDFQDIEQDLSICSSFSNGFEIRINKLFLVSFSPMLKKCLTILDAKNDETFTIITDYDQDDLRFLVNFCTKGKLPTKLPELLKSDHYLKLFHSFGIGKYGQYIQGFPSQTL